MFTNLLLISGSSDVGSTDIIIVFLPTEITLKNPVRFVILFIPTISPILIECIRWNSTSTSAKEIVFSAFTMRS